MKTDTIRFAARLIAIAIATSGLGGCALFSSVHVASTTNERECLARAMYFESNRSSDDGMLAVGTVVMNRKESGRYPTSVCGVVGQRVQFAPGALTKQMNDAGRPRAYRIADAVLAGKRYPGMKGVYFFHTAGYTYPYSNMHYVAVAGGNAFYEKRRSPNGMPMQAPVMVAQADPVPAAPSPEPVMASAEPRKRREYNQPVAAQPLPQLAEYRPDSTAQADDVLPPVRRHSRKSEPQIAQADDAGMTPDMASQPEVLPPVRSRNRKAQPQFAQNDDAPSSESLPPVRPRGHKAQTQVAQNDVEMTPDALPPVRPRGSVGQAHIAQPPIRNRAPQPQVAQFNFEQGPSGIDPSQTRQPARQQRPRAVAQARAVPTLRIQSVPVEADMGGMSEPAPRPKPAKSRSSLEPDPLY